MAKLKSQKTRKTNKKDESSDEENAENLGKDRIHLDRTFGCNSDNSSTCVNVAAGSKGSKRNG
ncbi:MAG: hypothetical protein RAP03_16450 [Candidatus Electryonea clarkiae]|nr:hypothetical protein [Candidatus Electryonea clarkiae]